MGKKKETKAVAEEKPEEKPEEKAEEEAEEETEEKPEEKSEDETVKSDDEEKVEENGIDEEKPAEKDAKKKKGKKDVKKDVKKEAKKETKKEEKKEDKEGKEGESSDEEPELGTLEKPIEILTAKRERKDIVRLVQTPKSDDTEIEEFDYTKGKGVILRDVVYIKFMIDDADGEDLEVLHKLMYKSGKKRKRSLKYSVIKKEILDFQGYPYDKDHKYYKSMEHMVRRLTIAGIKWINGILGLPKSKDKETQAEEMREALMDFLTEPKDLGLPAPAKRQVKSKPKTKGGRGKGKRTPKRAAKDPSKKTKDVSESEDEDEVSEASGSDEQEEEEEEKPAKKSPKKKPTPKKKATPVKIALPGKRGKRKSAASSAETVEESESEDDEPLVKKKKKSAPSDAELKKSVSTILKDADLEEVTMKNVVRQIYDKFPQFDLSSRKDFIKSTVKQMIS